MVERGRTRPAKATPTTHVKASVPRAIDGNDAVIHCREVCSALRGGIAPRLIGVQPAPAGVAVVAAQELIDVRVGHAQGVRLGVRSVIEHTPVRQAHKGHVTAHWQRGLQVVQAGQHIGLKLANAGPLAGARMPITNIISD